MKLYVTFIYISLFWLYITLKFNDKYIQGTWELNLVSGSFHFGITFSTKVKTIQRKSSNDMDYYHYSEKFLSAIQHVLLEMLSDS